MTAPDRLADRPWWRWDVRLTATGLDTSTPQPDLSDPLLPGWLVHLLRELRGVPVCTRPDPDGPGWLVVEHQQGEGWSTIEVPIGKGAREIAALVAALDATGAR